MRVDLQKSKNLCLNRKCRRNYTWDVNVVQFLNRIYVKFRNFAKFYVNSKS
jgi:hypothetical protein